MGLSQSEPEKLPGNASMSGVRFLPGSFAWPFAPASNPYHLLRFDNLPFFFYF